MKFTIELDGRVIAEVPELPGVLVYAHTEQEAIAKVQALAFRVLADQVEHSEASPEILASFFVAA